MSHPNNHHQHIETKRVKAQISFVCAGANLYVWGVSLEYMGKANRSESGAIITNHALVAVERVLERISKLFKYRVHLAISFYCPLYIDIGVLLCRLEPELNFAVSEWSRQGTDENFGLQSAMQSAQALGTELLDFSPNIETAKKYCRALGDSSQEWLEFTAPGTDIKVDVYVPEDQEKTLEFDFSGG